MPQILYAKTPGGGTRAVTVLRSWSDISGSHIFLHTNGVYGYKDGSPVKSENELNNLPLEHSNQALSWWNRTGKQMSEAHYRAIEERNSANAGDYQEKLLSPPVAKKLTPFFLIIPCYFPMTPM